MASKILTYPEIATVKQKLYNSAISNIPGAVSETISNILKLRDIMPGQTVAVAVGSRGITNIDKVVFQCVKFLKKKGLRTFILPAMGSHGGAAEGGQKAILEKLGISESTMQTPVKADMAVKAIGELSCGLKIFIAAEALKADHIVVINRVKPHTKFKAEIESGLCKMLTIGLGKAQGAAEFHRQAIHHSFTIIEDAAKTVIQKCNILFGLALTENGYGDLTGIEAIPPEYIIDIEKTILSDVYKKMAKIPFDNVDILIVDMIGKDISGIGMDSKVTGRHRDITGDFCTAPHPKRIFVRELSPDSDGNANGIGLADVTTSRLINAIDMKKTYINSLTAISPEKAAIPIHFETDKEAIDACASTIGIESLENAGIVRIKSTKHLDILQVSKAFEQNITSNTDLELMTSWEPLTFDANDNLKPLMGNR